VAKLGLIVNPIAGMGGKVGLKGTDGPEIVQKAREMGAEPWAPGRAVKVLRPLKGVRELNIICYPGTMGENEAKEVGLNPRTIGALPSGSTSARHTREAAQKMKELDVELLLFAGGDGTARDIYFAVGEDQTVLGVPAGVKIQSGVFGRTPSHAGRLAKKFLEGEISRTKKGEVMDIDEAAFREGSVNSKLFGYLTVPDSKSHIQGIKTGTSPSESYVQQAIAEEVTENMNSSSIYLIGPGTTTRPVMKKLGLDYSLLGVDALRDGELLGSDLREEDLLELTEEGPAELVVTPIGGQGHLFGRGNQQISPEVITRITKEGITVVATPGKIASLEGEPLLVDTGDPEVDEALCGYIPVITGYREQVVYRVSR